MFNTDQVGESPEGAARAEKVAELCCTVERGGIEDDVVVYVPLVGVSAHDTGVTALEEALGQISADKVCLLRRYLAGLKRLAYVVRYNARLPAPCALRILALRERELGSGELRRASAGVDKRAVFSFLRVLDIVHALSERANDALPA